jgi:hypothetical protein
MSGKPADSASKCCRRVGADARPNWHEVARQARLQAITRFLAGKKSPVARADEALEADRKGLAEPKASG